MFRRYKWEQTVDLHNRVTEIEKQVATIVRLCMTSAMHYEHACIFFNTSVSNMYLVTFLHS